MELKDWICCIGILFSVGLSICSLYITLINRRNTVREHLYKEQLALYLLLMEQARKLLVGSVQGKNFATPTEESTLAFIKQKNELSLLIASKEIILPGRVINQLAIFLDYARELEDIMHRKHVIESYRIINFKHLYDQIVNNLRAEIGIERLAAENLKVFGGESKNT